MRATLPALPLLNTELVMCFSIVAPLLYTKSFALSRKICDLPPFFLVNRRSSAGKKSILRRK